MLEVYPSPGGGESRERARLLDGSPCTVLDSFDTSLDRRRQGYDQGLWTHDVCLCLRTGRLVIASTRLYYGDRREVIATSSIPFENQVPGN